MITFEIIRIIDTVMLLVFICGNYVESHHYSDDILKEKYSEYPKAVITVDER